MEVGVGGRGIAQMHVELKLIGQRAGVEGWLLELIPGTLLTRAGFARSIQNYSQILQLFQDSRLQVSDKAWQGLT